LRSAVAPTDAAEKSRNIGAQLQSLMCTTAIYTKWCAQTFPSIFRLFAILIAILQKLCRHLRKNENYLAHLKGQSILKNAENGIKIDQ